MPDKINQLYTILKSKQESGEVGEIPSLEAFSTTLANEKTAREMYESRKGRFPDIFYGASFEEWYPTVKKKESTKPSGDLSKDVSTPKSESSSELWGQNLKDYEEKNRPNYTGPIINQNAAELIQKGKDSLAVDSTDIDRIIGQAGNQFDVFGEGVKIAPRFGKEKYTSEEMAGRVNRSEASLEYFQELSKKRDSQLNKFADKYKKAADLKLAETKASMDSFSLNAQNAYKKEVEDFKNTLPQPKTEEEAAALNKQLQDFNKAAFDKLNSQVKKFSERKATEYRNYIDKNINEEWDKEANAGAKVYDKENTDRVKGIFESDKFQKLPFLDQKALVGSVWYREKLRLMKQGKSPKEIADAKDWFYLQALGSSISNPKNKTPLSPFAIRSWAENMTNEIDARIAEQKKELPGNNLGLDQQNFIPQMKDLQNLEQAKALIAEINNMPDEDLGEYWEGATAANKIPFASAVNELGKNLRLYEVATKENRSKADDLLLLAKGMQTDIESVIDPSFSYKVGKQTAEMLPYIGEFILTGGAFTGAQAATTEMLTKKLGAWASSKVAQRAVIKPLGVLMGTLAQTTANPQMYLNNMVERMSPRFEASFSDKGTEIVSKLDYNTKDLEVYSTGHGEDAFTAALRGYGLAVSEIFTERLGELAFEPAGAAIAKKLFGDPELAKRMTLAMWLKKRNITPEQGAMEILTKQMAWNGIISELGEELVNMPLSNVISDRPIGEGMDADNLSVLAATIVSVGAVTGGLSAASKALSKKTTPLSYTVNGEERTIEVSPDMAKAVDFMNKKPDYFDIEQFKNSVFPNVDMPEKDRETLISIINSIQDKADLKPFTEKNGPIYNRIEGETEEEPQDKNLIDITGYQTDAEKEESEGYARQLPPHLTPKQELKNIEKALKNGKLTEDEIKNLQGRYTELSSIIQKEIDEKEAKKAEEADRIAKKAESDRLRAEREAKRKEEPLVPVEWSPMVNDVIVGRVNQFNSMSAAKRASKRGLLLLNQIGKSAGAHNLELKEVKSGNTTRLEIYKDGKKLQKTPLPTEFVEPTPEQYDFAKRAIKYGIIPPGADLGLTETEMQESLKALEAGKKTIQAIRLVHAIDKAKSFEGVDIADIDVNGKKTGRRTFVSFDEIEEVMNEGYTGPAITPEEEDILAAAYDELYGSLDEVGKEEIDNLFTTDNETNNEQQENEDQQAGSGQKNENDNGSAKKGKSKKPKPESVEVTPKANWSELENEVWGAVLSKKSGLTLPNKEAVKDYQNLVDEGIVYVDSFGSGKTVSLKLTEKGLALVEKEQPKSEKPDVKDIKSKKEEIVLYHGGNLDLEGFLYLASDKRQATEYAKGNGGKVHEYKLDKSMFATEDEARSIISEMGLESKEEGWDLSELGIHEIIDNRFDTSLSDDDIQKLVEEIRNRGYEGISFMDEDLLQENKAGVENYVVFDIKALGKAKTTPKKTGKKSKEVKTNPVGNDYTNSALDDIGDIFMESQIDMFSTSDPRRGKSDLRKDYEKTLAEATKELKDAGKDLESTKQAARAKGVEENTLAQILRPKQARYDLALKQYQIVKDLEKRVKEGEQSQQTLFEGKSTYNPNQMTLDFNNPQQVEISHGSKENLFKNIEKTVKGIEGHYNFNDYKEQVENQLGSQSASDVILKYITERTILQEFKQKGFVSLVGKKIHGPQDVADAMLIFRSPFVEHMMVVVVDTYGNIVHNATFTLNHPRMVGVDTNVVVDNIEAIEATYPGTKTYLAHNHPSGNHNPSDADKTMTIDFAKKMADAGLNFGGHIVIDTTKFTFIDGEGVATTKDYKSLPEKFFKPRLNVQNNVGYLEPADLMGVAKTIFENQGFNEMAFFLDSMNSISYASVIPVGMNEGQTKLWLERNMRANGAPFVFIASKLGNTKSNYEYSEVRDYIYIDESNKTIESWVNKGYFQNGSKKILSGTFKDTFKVVGFASAQEEENPYLAQAQSNNELMAKANLNDDAKVLIDGWYSRLDEVIRLKGNAQKGSEWLKWIEARANEGKLSREEVYWTGLGEWLEEKRDAKVTVPELRDFIKNNRIELAEKVLRTENELGPSDGDKKIAEIKLWFSENGYNIDYNQLDGYSITTINEHEDVDLNALESMLGINYSDTELVTVAERTNIFYEFDSNKSDKELAAFIREFVKKAEEIKNIETYHKVDEDTAINSTRLAYTSSNLENKKEIVLYVDTTQKEPFYIKAEREGKIIQLDFEYNRGDALDALENVKKNGYKIVSENVSKNKKDIAPYNQNDKIHFGTITYGKAMVWVRFGDVTTDDGRKVMVIDEIQSQRHEAGRDRGYQKTIPQRKQRLINEGLTFQKNGSYYNVFRGEENVATVSIEGWDDSYTGTIADLERRLDLYDNHKADVPDAPFKKNYTDLAIKRALRFAVENGYDAMAWNTGEQISHRFNIAKVIDTINYVYYPTSDYYFVTSELNQKQNFSETDISIDRIKEVFGSEIANKIKNGEGKEYSTGLKELKVDQQTVGGEPMKKYYGSVKEGRIGDIGKITEKIAKSFDRGAFVAPISTNQQDFEKYKNDITYYSGTDKTFNAGMALPITDSIREGVMSQGMFMMEPENEYRKPVQLSPENISKLQALTNTLFGQGHTKFEDIMDLLIQKYGVEKVTDSNNSQGVSMLDGMKAVYSSMLPFLDGDQYSEFKDVKNYNPNDNTSTELGAQSDSGPAPVEQPVLQGDIPAIDQRAEGRIVGTENGEFSIAGLQPGGDLFSPQPIPPTIGESGVGGVRGGERGVVDSDKASSGLEQLGLFGTSGVQPESKPRATDEEYSNIDGTQRQYTDKLEAQKNAPKKAIIGDIKNIAETLPYLMDGQIEDVWKAETRMLKDGKKGILFGNQTGTGKTLLFLGVAYRTLLNDPNAEIIIISPKGPIQQTINSAKILGMDFVNVEGRTDAGAQLSITTYQNFYANKSLLDRTPALVIFDESQNLLENQKGDESVYLQAARHLVSTPNEAPYKAAEILYGKQPEWVDMGNNEDYHRWRDVVDRNKEAIAIKGKALEQKTKVMLMSATPFAHEFGLRYADGILFIIDQGVERRTGGGYNSGSNDALFFITNFGYRMRHNKLTRPDAKVNIDIMYRAFADKLMKEGAMSTRLMDVPFDYSREFINVGRGAGTKIDDGIDLLESERYRFPTSDAFRYDYLAPLLEAIKAKESIQRIKQHLALGRKVVVFHGYNNPVPEHPFGPRLLKFAKSEQQMNALQMFWAEHPEYKEMTLGLKNPIQTYKDAFGDKVLFINGGVPDATRERNKNLFNEDPNYNFIVVNMSAGGAGLSLHDNTGAFQRALLNLGLPVRPVFTIQTEGRTYRTGQMSNAIFEYLITGLNFEMIMFGTKIAERVNATEALVLGSMARNLREVFRKGYIEANTLPPSIEQGVGGKEGDKSVNNSTPYEYAKSLFWGQQKGRKNDLGKDYFATPEPIGLKMMEFGDIKTGEKVLEPSAGHGAIARFAPEDAILHIVEPSSELRARLIVNISPDRVVASNFEDYYIGNHYNVIAMNPPFGSGGKTAMDHVAKAFKHLYNGGRLVAIIPNGQGEARFSKWYESEEAENAVLVAKIEMPAMFSERAGTGALTSIYVIDRIEDEETRAAQQPALYVSYAGVKDNNELFDRIENLSIRPRVEVALNDEAMQDLKEAAMQKEMPFTDHEFLASSGQKWLIARLTERVDYEEGFKPISEIAKKNNGWYMKKGGKGFAFKEDNDRQQFKQEAYAFIKNLNPESDIDGMVNEAEADLRDFIKQSMGQMNANPFGTIIEFGAKLGKVLGLRIIQGANSLMSILDRLGIPATDTIRRLWVKMNAVADKYWRQPQNIVTLKQPYIYIGMRNVPYFGAVMNRAFDGTTNMHQVFFNLNTEITNMDILIIGNPTAPTTPMLRLVKQATTELMTFITYMNHADTMAYVDDLRRDRLPAPILYDYAYTEKESLVYNYVYGFRPIDTLIKNLRSAGAIISESENPVIGTDLYPGRVADKARSFEESVISSVKGPFGKPVHGASLIERMIKDGINLGEMDAKTRSAHGEALPGFYLGFTYGYETIPTFPEYLHALHAKERNAEVAKRRQERWENKKIELENNIANNISVGLNRAKLELLITNLDPEYQLIPDGGSGMFDYEADAVLDEMLNNPEKLALYNQYAAEFTREVIMPIQEELVRTGQLSQGKMDELNQMFPNWVHLPVDFYSKDLNSTGLASSKVRSPLKKVKGSVDRRVNPFLATIDYYSKVLRAGEMNLARQQMYNLIRKYPNENLFKIVPPVSGVYYDADSGILVPEFSVEPPNSIPVYRNGQIYYIQFVGKNGAKLYDAWMSINKTHDRTLVHRFFRSINAALYFANIKFNPTFLVTNLIRDDIASILNSLALDEVQQGLVRAKLAAKIPVYTPLAIRAAYQASRGKNTAANQTMLDYAIRLQNQGGLTVLGNIVGGQTLDERVDKMMELISAMDGMSLMQQLSMPGSYLLNALGDMQSAVENGTRIAAFRASIEAGLSDQAAAAIAKNITVNFDRKGAIGGSLNDFIWLFKTSASGVARFAKALNTKEGKVIAAGLIGMGAALALWNRSRCPEAWDSLDPQIKLTKIVFVTDCEHTVYPSIPFAQGWSFFVYLGQVMADYAMNAMDGQEATANVALAAVNSTNPTGTSTDYQSFSTNFMPTALDKGLEFAVNRTWYDKPISPEQYSFEDKVKDSELAWEETSIWAKELATWLSTSTGGSNAKNEGAIEISPATLEYAFKTITGGAGRDIVGMGVLISDIKEGNLGENITKYPGVRALVTKVSSQTVMSEIYKIYEHGETNPITVADTEKFRALTMMRLVQVQKIEDPEKMQKEFARLETIIKNYSNLVVKDLVSNILVDKNLKEISKIISQAKK